jgi:hypothetical protein
MKSKAVFLILILLFSLAGSTSSFSQKSSLPCLAVITGLKGNVLIKKANQPEFVKTFWGTQLFRGDQIKTTSESEVTLTFSNNNLVKLESNSMITISDENPSTGSNAGNVKKLSSEITADLSSITMKRNNNRDLGALASLRSGNEETVIELNSPYNTALKSNRPVFTWTPKKQFDDYIVNLYNSKGLVWSRKVTGNALNYPVNEKGLEFGEAYFWNVEGEDLINTEKSSNLRFTVLPADKSKEIDDQETIIRKTFANDSDSSSMHSFLGAFYIKQGLYQDAIREFQIISGINPDAPLPHEILGSLFSDTGNKDKAIEELQKALALTKSREK